MVTRPETPPGSRPSLLAEGSAAGLMFLAGPAAGYFLGKWLGAFRVVPMLAILKIVCDRVRPLKVLGHFLEG